MNGRDVWLDAFLIGVLILALGALAWTWVTGS